MSVRIRIEGSNEREVRDAAQRMGVAIQAIYPKRDRRGVLAYGYLPQQMNVTVVSRPALPAPRRRNEDDIPF